MERKPNSKDPFDSASERVDFLVARAVGWMDSTGETLIQGIEERTGRIDQSGEQAMESMNISVAVFLVNLHVKSLRASQAMSPVLRRLIPIDPLADLNITYRKPESRFLEIADSLTTRNFSGRLKEASPQRKAEFARLMAATFVKKLLVHAARLEDEMISDSLRRTARQIFLKVGVKRSNELLLEQIDPDWSNGLAADILRDQRKEELDLQLKAFISEPSFKE